MELKDELKQELKNELKQAAEKNSMKLKELKQAAEKNSMELKELKQAVEDGFDGLKQFIKQFSALQASIPSPFSPPSSGVLPVTRTSPQNKMASANDAAVATATQHMNDAMSAVSRA
eukprot:CAMPEP_0171930188 /NCGR_PEP_ID=MMETSP0993-20121228/28338_1 /TAXON_ID=483369 /ORGANISM="non described non described, Strain CCMP2098" /LENGTH=116 /DNA_ID=CAMNT_0012569911 /DNA_START=18 /DNA_END=364 /DNA_ORIENTATION=+